MMITKIRIYHQLSIRRGERQVYHLLQYFLMANLSFIGILAVINRIIFGWAVMLTESLHKSVEILPSHAQTLLQIVLCEKLQKIKKRN